MVSLTSTNRVRLRYAAPGAPTLRLELIDMRTKVLPRMIDQVVRRGTEGDFKALSWWRTVGSLPTQRIEGCDSRLFAAERRR